MSDDFTSILPSTSMPWERAVEKVSGERWSDLDIDILRRARDPWTCPEHLLPYLAHQRSVDIWDEAWPIWKQRAVIAAAPEDHHLKGTGEGLRRYVGHAGAAVRQIVTPPEGFFAAPDLPKDVLDAHIARHPKVRITLSRGKGTAPIPDGFFAGDGYAGEATTGVDDGPALYGRRAWLVRDGVQMPLQLSRLADASARRSAVDIERIVVPGVGVAYSFAADFVAGDSFADAWDVPPRYYTTALDRTYLHSASRLELSQLTVGFIPRDTRYTRESLTGTGGDFVFAGDHACEGFAGLDDGGELLADVLYLYDPDIASPVHAAGGFAGATRIGMPAHTADIMIDWQTNYRDHTGFVADLSFAGEDPASPADTARRDFLLDAVAASKRMTDRLGVTFQTRRDRNWSDGIPLDGTARLGEPVANYL